MNLLDYRCSSESSHGTKTEVGYENLETEYYYSMNYTHYYYISIYPVLASQGGVGGYIMKWKEELMMENGDPWRERGTEGERKVNWISVKTSILQLAFILINTSSVP